MAGGITIYPKRAKARTKAAKVLQRHWRGRSAVRSLTSKIKQVSLSQCETKTAGQQVGAISGSAAVDLFHNVTHYVPNLLKTTQGVTANPGAEEVDNRVGNEVIARGLRIKLQFISDPAHPNVNIQGYVFRYEANETPADSNFWAGPSGAGGTMLRFLDAPDTRQVKILKSFRVTNQNVSFNVDAGTTRYVHNVYKDLWVPLKSQKLKYDGNNSSVPKYKDIGMCFVTFDANNTLQTDIISYLSYTCKFYFKDP